MTVYDLYGYTVPNPSNRYTLGDRSNLKPDADGSHGHLSPKRESGRGQGVKLASNSHPAILASCAALLTASDRDRQYLEHAGRCQSKETTLGDASHDNLDDKE